MIPDTLYIVMGTTGEYSDRSEWPVVAYQDEATARRHCELAAARAIEIEVRISMLPYGRYDTQADILLRTNEWDPNMSINYTGTSYFVGTVRFSEAREPVSLGASPAPVTPDVP